MRSRRAFVHVGTPKTGTTFLQAVLWQQHDLALSQGLLLPLTSVHDHFLGALDVRAAAEYAPDPRLVAGTWQRMIEAAAEHDGDVLVSHELLAQASAEQAAAAVAGWAEADRDVHIVVTARDLARQLPAEWQERVKHRAPYTFTGFMKRLNDPDSDLTERFWPVQDVADVVRRWRGDLPADRVHVVTVPQPGGPRAMLWERFAGLLDLNPADYSLDVPRENVSLGLEQVDLLRRINLALGTRLPRPGPYAQAVKEVLAHGVLVDRAGTRPVLTGDDLEFARERSAVMVQELCDLGVDVIGDLAELQVPPGQPAGVSARVEPGVVPQLDESVAVLADLLHHFHQRAVRHGAEVKALRADVRRERARAEAAELELAALARRMPQAKVARVRNRLTERTRRLRERRGTPARSGPPKVTFLMYNVAGVGGVARTTINLANALAETHDVQILSMWRTRKDVAYPIADSVRVKTLMTGRPKLQRLSDEDAALAEIDTVLPHRIDPLNGLTDKRLRTALRELEGTLISTRPSLHVAAVTWAPEDVVTIGWDHLNFSSRYVEAPLVGAAIDYAVKRLDCLAVLTEGDARDYRDRHPGARIEVVRNSLAWPVVPDRGAREERLVVAAGRLSPEKGFDRLIDAWALLAEEFPDWECRIYGEGKLRDDLLEQIERHGVNVKLAGYTEDFAPVLASAAIFVMSSRAEGFPMSLIEALSVGTPLVSFDCPRGPGEIVRDGRNGRLVPDGDVAGMAAALGQLMRDRELRDRMGRHALRDAAQYDIEVIADRWRDLMVQLEQRTVHG